MGTIAEYLGTPYVIVIPLAAGPFSRMWKAFAELEALGWLERQSGRAWFRFRQMAAPRGKTLKRCCSVIGQMRIPSHPLRVPKSFPTILSENIMRASIAISVSDESILEPNVNGSMRYFSAPKVQPHWLP